MADDYALYRYFDNGDRLLYLGKSSELAERGKAHIRSSQWMQFAVRSTIERCSTPEEADRAEREAIKREHPLFNRQYNDTPEARERLRSYLEEAGHADLVPTRCRAGSGAGHAAVRGLLADAAGGDILSVLRQILTADTADHAGIRLWAIAALEGHADLPQGIELERLATLARVNRVTAYRTKKAALY